ncbi:MAG: type II toxin-antitoxin system YoeB family toxin, partial [Acidimicrobiales bacterium]
MARDGVPFPLSRQRTPPARCRGGSRARRNDRAPARPVVRLVFTPQGWDDYTHWQQADRAIVKRINRLTDDALRGPTDGIGKPE